MKFGYLILTIIIMPVALYGQSIKISTYLSPLLSNYVTESDQIEQNELKIDLGFSTGLSSEYFITKQFAFGAGLNYNFFQGEFYTPCFCVSTADRIILTRNVLSTHILEFPLFIKLRLSKNENRFFYLQGGVAMNWLISAKRIVEIETEVLNDSEIMNEEIADETFLLQNKNGNSIGSSFQFGIGRLIPIKKMNFYSELTFRKDINYWKYYAYQVPSVVEDFPIINSSLLLKLGVFLKN